MTAAKTKYEAARALSASDLGFLGEFEVVSEADVRALTDYCRVQVRRNTKLRMFVTARREQRPR